ncbi:hypothetical protein HNO88_004344 [Novosphingobium chloroacetimidivorans]|uniref:Uncharacterized protein n=1 Tax=Novosphingobium chloroacetimidivorans TaxID=1428314 RepID=A0A7W7KF14_9SPHN|nr:hypothetical protein [Novosphingobium chloroacetimidivorans]
MIEPLVLNKLRVDERRLLNGIFSRFRKSSPDAEMPEH